MKYDLNKLFDLFEAHSTMGFAVGVSFFNGTPQHSKFTYQPKFLKYYEDNNLILDDHTIKVGFSTDGIFTWRELEERLGPSRAFQACKDHGMNDGVCWSTTVNGFKSIGSVAFSSSAQILKCPKEEILQAFQMVTSDVSRQFIISRVSPKSKELLAEISKGQNVNEISKTLGISVHGVRKRQKTMISEMGAKNLAHAVSLAALNGLISEYVLV